MKSLVTYLLLASLTLIGCGKDKSGSGAASAPTDRYGDIKKQDTAICAYARYQGGRWYDQNGVELPQCYGLNNYMNSKYLFAYDNSYCSTRLYKKKPTFHIILNGLNRCAAEEYFQEFGNQNVMPQLGRSHYVGYAPPSFYNYQNQMWGGYNLYSRNRHPRSSTRGHHHRSHGRQRFEYHVNGSYRYCYNWGCDIGDGKWNFGDYAAISLGIGGLIFAIANH
ncbi:MAG: hypothetical protein KDD40_09705 [Bdellovibrionales bacterium]|nr:hypothetical protein [Bdellovibrionales bacterium]